MEFGLITRRECWTLSFRGKLLALGLIFTLAVAVRIGLYPFLAVNRPINAEMLIVEGWISPNLLEQAAAEFHHGHYRQVLVVRESDDVRYTRLAKEFSHDSPAGVLMQYGVPRETLA